MGSEKNWSASVVCSRVHVREWGSAWHVLLTARLVDRTKLLSESSSIHILAVAYLHNVHSELFVLDCIHDTIFTLPDPVPVLT